MQLTKYFSLNVKTHRTILFHENIASWNFYQWLRNEAVSEK